MQTILNRPSHILLVSLSPLLLVCATTAHADIFQWEYVDPDDPSQGKRQSATLVAEGTGVDAVPGADLRYRDLRMAHLIGADLTSVDALGANFTNADLSRANLANAVLYTATLADADFTGANLRGADFGHTGITLEQLYSTASYQERDLRCVSLGHNSLVGADFTGVDVRNAYLGYTGISLAQLYSTASYHAKDLTGIGLDSNDLTGGNFAGQNLANAQFILTILTDADFSGAEVRGASFHSSSATGFTAAQLYSTASYAAQDLKGIALSGDLTGWTFAGQNLTSAWLNATLTDVDFRKTILVDAQFGEAVLTGADFGDANLSNAVFRAAKLTEADFTGAEIRGVNFSAAPPPSCSLFNCRFGSGISVAQIYTTANYQAGDLSGINFDFNGLSGVNFAGQNLTNVSFSRTNLTEANLTSADLRGAFFDCIPCVSGIVASNSIWWNSHISGLDLAEGELLVVRDYDGNPSDDSGNPVPPIPITVDQHLLMGPGGTLRMVFETDAWDSTISLAPDIPVTLGGNLELAFADNANLASQVGRTIKIFDWTGVTPTGTFTISSPYTWDLSALYTTGQVTLTAVPEPGTIWLSIFVLAAILPTCRLRRLPRRGAIVAASTVLLAFSTSVSRADIYQWEYIDPTDPSQGKRQSPILAPDGAGVDAMPSANLFGRNLTKAYLIGRDLIDARVHWSNLTGADLSQANLTSAFFAGTTVTGAEFAGAEIRAANFDARFCVFGCHPGGTGLTLAQLYSTASYKARDLRGINLARNYLVGGNFAGQNLTNAGFVFAKLIAADFRQANLANANFAEADLTGANFRQANLSNANFAHEFACDHHACSYFYATLAEADLTGVDLRGGRFDLSGAITTNLIVPDGHIGSLNLIGSELLIVNDYDGNPRWFPYITGPIPITVDQHLTMGPDGTLRMVFEADAWDSTISFAPGIPVALGGTLELTFAADVNVASQVGRTLRIFDWTGVDPVGMFSVSSPYHWDTSDLYTTGQITLTAIPEPTAAYLALLALVCCLTTSRRATSFGR